MTLEEFLILSKIFAFFALAIFLLVITYYLASVLKQLRYDLEDLEPSLENLEKITKDLEVITSDVVEMSNEAKETMFSVKTKMIEFKNHFLSQLLTIIFDKISNYFKNKENQVIEEEKIKAKRTRKANKKA